MAFTGKASYDNIALVGEDVSDLVALLAPTETPFLNLLSAAGPATSTWHQWTEELIGPSTIIASAAVNSATAATGILINATGTYLQAGMLLQLESGAPGVGNEVVQITSAVGANSILVARNKGGVVSSLAAGGTITVLGTAALEGDDVLVDVTRKTTRGANATQIFKKDIIISGTDMAMSYAPNAGDMFNHQAGLRLRENLRDLEKTIFRGVLISSVGTSAITRTMQGLESKLTGINSTIVAASFTANPVLYINDVWQRCWDAGARDIDVLVAGATWKRDISGTNASVLSVEQADTTVQRKVEYFQGDFGAARVVLSPWIHPSSFFLVSSGRVRPVPLQGRSFQIERTAKVGDAVKGMVVGEYTVEIHQAQAMAQAHI